jgi:hypothetical protein
MAVSVENREASATSITTTTLTGNRMWLARAIWTVITALTAGTFIFAIPSHWRQLQQIGVTGEEKLVQLNQAEADALAQIGLTMPLYASYHVVVHALFTLVFVTVGIVLVWRRSDDWSVLYHSLALIIFAATYTPTIDDLAVTYPQLAVLVLSLRQVGLAVTVGAFFLFPDGQFVPKWTRLIALVWSVAMLAIPFFPEFQIVRWEGSAMNVAGFGLVLAMYGLGSYAQVHRFRSVASPAQQQQTKWVILGLMAGVFGTALFVVINNIISATARPGMASLLYDLIGLPFLALFPLLLIPLAVAFALLRYRLWKIDFILNRSLVYSGLTIVLALAFGAILFVLQIILRLATGSEQPPVLGLVVATLAVGALFQPTRQRMRWLVDRHVYGIHVDYRSQQDFRHVDIGNRVGPYEMLEPIGMGGMAEVYKGMHTSLGRPVAIKVLSASRAGERDFRARFEREARLVAGLKHPNIVQVYDSGEVNGAYYMVMEYMAGASLAERLQQRGRLTYDETVTIMNDIATALDYAHEQGIVHRDVKPANVLLHPATDAGSSGRDRAVLTDFGIARITRGGNDITGTGTVGTLDYIAPEQIQTPKQVDGRADIYALGIMLYQMLTGKLPFVGDHPGVLVMAHLFEPVPDPRKIVPDLPDRGAAVILKATAKSPAARYATAMQMAADLKG